MSVEKGIIKSEVKRRRTFAIISHPDAGKTTLTEKLLLYSGMIQQAGEVKAKTHRKKTVSDWMELEQERGISVSSTVLQFEYESLKINLLDTPGHKDFSEDTYRTLMAADAAVMVMDAAKGVEIQTRKLFEVCRLRGLPVLTFVNKMDREALDPLELMEQVEEVLGIAAIPITWPIGMGDRFKGVYDRMSSEFVFFTPSEKSGFKAAEKRIQADFDDPILLESLDEEEIKKLKTDLELLDGVLGMVSREDFLNGVATPTLFGSAKNNFGIASFLEKFKEYSPEPIPKETIEGECHPYDERFSAFVFKIQANMDKKHRDRMAFMRICSGCFSKDMDVTLSRESKKVRMAHAKQFWGQERTTIHEAYAGDIVGIHDPGHYRIGDTVFAGGKKLEFIGIPQFSPECFGKLLLRDPLKRKQLQKGIKELGEEGMVQVFIDPKVGMQDPILGVVGVLQFDVMVFRLKDEYGVDVRLERLAFQLARWVDCENIDDLKSKLSVPIVQDLYSKNVALFKSQWEFEYAKKNIPDTVKWKISSRA